MKRIFIESLALLTLALLISLLFNAVSPRGIKLLLPGKIPPAGHASDIQGVGKVK